MASCQNAIFTITNGIGMDSHVQLAHAVRWVKKTYSKNSVIIRQCHFLLLFFFCGMAN